MEIINMSRIMKLDLEKVCWIFNVFVKKESGTHLGDYLRSIEIVPFFHS